MRRLPELLLWGGLCLCWARPAAADAEHDRCIAASDGTNTAWAACGADLLKREDGRLNGAWKRVFAGLPDETRNNLLDEQRAWNAFKGRAACSTAAAIGGGKGRCCTSRSAVRR